MRAEWLLAFKDEFAKLPKGAKIAVGGIAVLVAGIGFYEYTRSKNATGPSASSIVGTPTPDPNAPPQGIGGLSALDTNSLASMIAGLVNTQGKTGETGPQGPAGAPAPPPPPPTTGVPVPPPPIHGKPIGHPITPPPQPLVKYTVKPGDNLSAISYRLHTPGGWQNLYNLNKGVIGSNPNLIKPGQVLVLPR